MSTQPSLSSFVSQASGPSQDATSAMPGLPLLARPIPPAIRCQQCRSRRRRKNSVKCETVNWRLSGSGPGLVLKNSQQTVRGVIYHHAQIAGRAAGSEVVGAVVDNGRRWRTERGAIRQAPEGARNDAIRQIHARRPVQGNELQGDGLVRRQAAQQESRDGRPSTNRLYLLRFRR